MTFTQIYLLLGIALAVLSFISGRTGKVRTRNDGSEFSAALLLIFIWPLAIVAHLMTVLIKKIRSNKKSN